MERALGGPAGPHHGQAEGEGEGGHRQLGEQGGGRAGAGGRAGQGGGRNGTDGKSAVATYITVLEGAPHGAPP